MHSTTELRPAPRGLFVERPSPRLYDLIVEVLRVRHRSGRTKTYIHRMRWYIEFQRPQHPRKSAEVDEPFLVSLGRSRTWQARDRLTKHDLRSRAPGRIGRTIAVYR
jgi:hypothetical protein